MEETTDRLARVGRVEELGPEVEQAFAAGLLHPPLTLQHRTDPVVRLLLAGSNVALVGPPGAGKRSIAYSVRRSTVWRDQPQLCLDLDASCVHPNSWPTYRTTVRHWLEGAIYVGNLEQKVTLICRRATADSIVIFESIGQAIGAWKSRDESLDLVDLLVDVAMHPKIHMVVTATPAEWSLLKTSKPDFATRFVVVEVEPPEERESRMIVSLSHHSEHCSQAAVDEVFRLARAHYPLESSLGVATRILGAVESSTRGRAERNPVREACARDLGVLREWVGADRVPDTSALVARLESEVVGHAESCSAVADDLVLKASGLADSSRPLSYVLAGTPGTGKTSLAKAIQHALGGIDSQPLRFDCSEYPTPFDVMRLLSTERGSLVSGLMNRPGTVVLFDEVDRLDPSGRDLLHQVLGEGRITSLSGETVSCANAVVVMTTNVGSEAWLLRNPDRTDALEAAGIARGACSEMLGAAITSRITRILVFPPLRHEHARAIVDAEVKALAEKIAEDHRGLSLTVSDELIAAIAEIGTSTRNGARGLQRAVREVVAVPVARYLNECRPTGTVLNVAAIHSGCALEGVRVESVPAGAAAMPGHAAAPTVWLH